MALPTFKEISNLETINEIKEELFIQKKKLFELRIQKKVAKNQQLLENHLPRHIKRRVVHLELKKKLILEKNQKN